MSDYRYLGIICENINITGATNVCGNIARNSSVGTGSIAVTGSTSTATGLDVITYVTYAYLGNIDTLGVVYTDGTLLDVTYTAGVSVMQHSGGVTLAGTHVLNGPMYYTFLVTNGGLTLDVSFKMILNNGALASNISWFVNGDITMAPNTHIDGCIISNGGTITFSSGCSSAGSLITVASDTNMLGNVILGGSNSIISTYSQAGLDATGTDTIASLSGQLLTRISGGSSGLSISTSGALLTRYTSCVKSQFAPIILNYEYPTVNAALITSSLINGIVRVQSSTGYGVAILTLQMDDASTVLTFLRSMPLAYANLSANDSIDFSVINETLLVVTLLSGSEYVIGASTVLAGSSGMFRLRLVNTSTGSESYEVYRLY